MPTPDTTIVPVVGSDIDRLLASPDPGERLMALKDDGITEHHLWRAIQDPNLNVFWEALRHPLTNAAQLDYAVKNRASNVNSYLLEAPAFASDHLDQILQRPEEFGMLPLSEALRSTALTGDQMRSMLDNKYKIPVSWRTLALRNPALTPDDLRGIFPKLKPEGANGARWLGMQGTYPALSTLLQNPSTPGDVLAQAHAENLHLNDGVRRALAENPNTPSEVIGKLAFDLRTPWDTLNHVVKNPNFTREHHARAMETAERNPSLDVWEKSVLQNSPFTSPDDLLRAYTVPNPEARERMLRELVNHPAQSNDNFVWMLKNQYLPSSVHVEAANKAPRDQRIFSAAVDHPLNQVVTRALDAHGEAGKRISPEMFDKVRARDHGKTHQWSFLTTRAMAESDLPPERLRELYQETKPNAVNRPMGYTDEYSFVHELLQHPNLPADVATDAAQSPEPGLRFRAVKSGKLDEATLRNLVMNDPDETTRLTAVEMGGPKIALAGLTSKDPNVRLFTVREYKHDLTPEMWEQAFTDPNSVVRGDAVKYAPAMFPDQQTRAVLDEDPSIREKYAERHDVPADHLDLLVKDPVSTVRRSAINHPRFPLEKLEGIANDEKQNPDVRLIAQKKYRDFDPDHPDVGNPERVRARLGTNKLRAVRDQILDLGLEEAHPKQLPPGDWKAGRTPQGLISAKRIQHYIDALPFTEFNVSHGRWEGAQRHNQEPSKVMRFELTNDQVRKLHAAGAFGSFLGTNRELGQYHEMPVHTVGWVRYTGTPKDGIHVDEIQSDFTHSLYEKAGAEARAHGYDESLTKDLLGRAAAVQNPAHHNAIKQILFGNKEPTEWVHEAFLQYLRDHGHNKAVVHIPSAAFTHRKLTVVGHAHKNKPPPAHVLHTYDSMPKKAGYEDAQYGEIPTQSNPQWKPAGDSAGEHTRKTIVRKFEDDPSDEEEVYISDADHFISALRPEIRKKGKR